MKKILKFLYIIPAFILSLPVIGVHAQGTGASLDFPTSFGNLTDKPLKEVVGNIVQIVLGFLGILTVLIILMGGFKWMTSGGNEDKIGEAKKLISAGVVGLVIVLAAYAIAGFIVSSLTSAV